MRVRSILIVGAGILLAGAGASEVVAKSPAPGFHGSRPGGMHRWGPRPNGRWYAGWRAPGGWNGYRRPVRGYVLPRYWVSPAFFIPNYTVYGLPAPAYGYGWSRYYDDAVMTDRYGRVYDYRSDIDWGRYDGGYDDGDHADRRDDGVGGAAIGAVVGGIAGNRIAGRGNRTEGTLIGAGVGAVAGYAIDKAEDGRRRDAPPPPDRPGAPYDYRYGDDTVTTANDYEGRWTGTWRGADGKSYSGTYEGRFEGTAQSRYGVDYDAPPYEGPAHWSNAPAPGAPIVTTTYGPGGYVAGGYYYPAPVVTTVTVQPAVTTTTTTTYVTEKVAYRNPVRKVRSCRCK